MTAGILKEPQAENRVSFLPEQAESLVKQQVKVIIEKNAGINAFANDELYVAKGCQLASRKEVLQQSDILLSIHPLMSNYYLIFQQPVA